jgi:hypothetical protein
MATCYSSAEYQIQIYEERINSRTIAVENLENLLRLLHSSFWETLVQPNRDLSRPNSQRPMVAATAAAGVQKSTLLLPQLVLGGVGLHGSEVSGMGGLISWCRPFCAD